MEYKEFQLSNVELKQDGDQYTFEGYASTFGNEDRVGDVIEKGAFTMSLAKRKPKLLWQHKTDEIIGVFDEMREDDRGLYAKGRLFPEVQRGKEAYALLKGGAIDSMSIGFSIPKGSAEYDRERDIRIIKQVDLYETSLVTFPANEMAQVTGVKNELPRTEREFEQFLRDAGYSRKQAKGITLEGFKAEGNQRDAGLEAIGSEDLTKLQNTFNQFIEGLKS